MAIRYYRLFDTLNRRGLQKTDLLEKANISAPTLAKLSRGETIKTDIIERICIALDVQPGDIMEVVKDSQPTPPRKYNRSQKEPIAEKETE